jgi:hypothetical protein
MSVSSEEVVVNKFSCDVCHTKAETHCRPGNRPGTAAYASTLPEGWRVAITSWATTSHHCSLKCHIESMTKTPAMCEVFEEVYKRRVK